MASQRADFPKCLSKQTLYRKKKMQQKQAKEVPLFWRSALTFILSLLWKVMRHSDLQSSKTSEIRPCTHPKGTQSPLRLEEEMMDQRLLLLHLSICHQFASLDVADMPSLPGQLRTWLFSTAALQHEAASAARLLTSCRPSLPGNGRTEQPVPPRSLCSFFSL